MKTKTRGKRTGNKRVGLAAGLEDKIRRQVVEQFKLQHSKEVEDAFNTGRKLGREDELRNMVGTAPTFSNEVVVPIAIVRGYEELANVLVEALNQAQAGKGRERHAKGMPFNDQPIMRMPALQQDTKGLNYQVCKKMLESENLAGLDSKVKERLGAIVYAAASIIAERKLAVDAKL